MSDVERPNRPNSYSSYEFISAAGLQDNGRLLVGRRALNLDIYFPLKTLLTYYSGITRPVSMQTLTGGKELLSAVSANLITRQMMRHALEEHFSRLREAALWRAEALGLRIRTIVLSYPSWLCEHEYHKDWDLYRNCYLNLMRPLWPGDTIFTMCSEGQAVAQYITENFHDSIGTSERKRLWDLIRSANSTDQGMELVVVDCGSSSLVSLPFFSIWPY